VEDIDGIVRLLDEQFYSRRDLEGNILNQRKLLFALIDFANNTLFYDIIVWRNVQRVVHVHIELKLIPYLKDVKHGSIKELQEFRNVLAAFKLLEETHLSQRIVEAFNARVQKPAQGLNGPDFPYLSPQKFLLNPGECAAVSEESPYREDP